jgi:hypothetical protein
MQKWWVTRILKLFFLFSKTTKSGHTWAANWAAEWYALAAVFAYHSAVQLAAQVRPLLVVFEKERNNIRILITHHFCIPFGSPVGSPSMTTFSGF